MDEKRGNGKRPLDLNGVFGVGDLMMLIASLDFSVTRSLFGDGADAAERLKEIVAELRNRSPLPLGARDLGFEWFRACRAVQSCSWYLAHVVETDTGYKGKTFHLDVETESEVHRVLSEGHEDEIRACLDEVHGFLRDLAPIRAERLRILKGLVDLPVKVEIPWVGDQNRTGRERYAGVEAALSDHLAPVSPFVRVIEARNSWIGENTVEARFAVPSSTADSVICFVNERNAPAVAEHRERFSSKPSEYVLGLVP